MKKLTKKQLIAIISTAIIMAGFMIGFLIYNRNLPTLIISKEKISLGEEGYFTVSAKNFKPEVAAFDITLDFDSDVVEILETTAGTLGVELALSKENYSNSSSKITALFLDYTGGDEPISIDGDLFYVRYKLKKPTASALTFSNVNIVNSDGVIQNNIKERSGIIEVR